MANILLKRGSAFIIINKEKGVNINLDPIDFKDKKYQTNIEDSIIIDHIESMPESHKDIKSWEQGFHILSFKDKDNQNKYSYYLKSSFAKKAIENNIDNNILNDAKERLKKGDELRPINILDLPIQEAIEEIDRRFSNNDLDFIKAIQKELQEYPDEDLSEYIKDRMSEFQDTFVMEDLDNMGIRQLHKLAESKFNISNPAKFNSKKLLIAEIKKIFNNQKDIKNIKKKLKSK